MQNRDPKHNVVMGIHTCEALLKKCKNRVISAYYTEPNKKTSPRKTILIKELQQIRVPAKVCSLKQLEQLCGSTSHQGIALVVKPRPQYDIETFLRHDEPSFVLALDSITDPHNLGAILRACECFKVDLVIWSKNRSAPITPTVAKTSASASELVPYALVSNLATTLDRFKKADFEIIGADVNEHSGNLFDYKFPKRSVLVMGSEGEGLRPIVKKKLDTSLFIPMFGSIDSLNVSQATAVCLSFWKSQAKS